ncbi:hypothetical protein D1970_05985 [Mesobacillus zeae]|uniref:Uncharacterized protein n=1 Tax=Mesobacillus zeae TaxID=1917180 RepID=A0A398BH55_9BACI|nr:hypothetical protein D1970_05985 [Mesobacillus zeae]
MSYREPGLVRAGAAPQAEWTQERQQEMAARPPPLSGPGIPGKRGSFYSFNARWHRGYNRPPRAMNDFIARGGFFY